jgi:signal transduction histidine kinase
VHIAETPTQVTLQVANDGAAIPDAEKDRIFRPHYRAAGQVHEEITGYGLGLAIVSVTVKHLDGSITVANRSGDQGSCFTVVFPAVASSASIDEE